MKKGYFLFLKKRVKTVEKKQSSNLDECGL